MDSYRSYLSKHLSAVRCEDNVKLLEQQIKEINYSYPENPFLIEDSKPLKVEQSPLSKSYFESDPSKTLLSELKDLRGYDDDDPATREPYTSASWQQKMLEYLRRLEAWDGSSETEAVDYFHQKCMLYRMLLRIAPAEVQSDHVVFSYLKLLAQPNAMTESRIEWLWYINELIRF